MKFIDATRDRTRSLWKRWRGRLRGAVDRTLASGDPRAAWAAALPVLRADQRRVVEAVLVLMCRRQGYDPDRAWLDERAKLRAKGEALTAAEMSPARAARLLAEAGIDLGRAMDLVRMVGPAVADAVAFLDVLDLVLVDGDEVGGAA